MFGGNNNSTFHARRSGALRAGALGAAVNGQWGKAALLKAASNQHEQQAQGCTNYAQAQREGALRMGAFRAARKGNVGSALLLAGAAQRSHVPAGSSVTIPSGSSILGMSGPVHPAVPRCNVNIIQTQTQAPAQTGPMIIMPQVIQPAVPQVMQAPSVPYAAQQAHYTSQPVYPGYPQTNQPYQPMPQPIQSAQVQPSQNQKPKSYPVQGANQLPTREITKPYEVQCANPHVYAAQRQQYDAATHQQKQQKQVAVQQAAAQQAAAQQAAEQVAKQYQNPQYPAQAQPSYPMGQPTPYQQAGYPGYTPQISQISQPQSTAPSTSTVTAKYSEAMQAPAPAGFEPPPPYTAAPSAPPTYPGYPQ